MNAAGRLWSREARAAAPRALLAPEHRFRVHREARGAARGAGPGDELAEGVAAVGRRGVGPVHEGAQQACAYLGKERARVGGHVRIYARACVHIRKRNRVSPCT